MNSHEQDDRATDPGVGFDREQDLPLEDEWSSDAPPLETTNLFDVEDDDTFADEGDLDFEPELDF